MHKSKILITGVTGFIGSHLVAFLNNYYPSCKIAGISRHKPNASCAYDFYSVNLLQQEDVARVIQEVKPDYIFHLAGLVFSYDWDALYRDNVRSTLNLLDALKKSGGTAHVVIAGSSAEYGIIPLTDLPVTETYAANPMSPYGMTKLWQTLISRYDASERISVTTGRIFNVIGCGTAQQLSTGKLFSQIQRIIENKQAPQLSVGNLGVKRDFLDVEDVCSALTALALKRTLGGVYNICSGHSVSLNTILELSLRVTKLNNLEIVVDNNIMQNTYVDDIYGCNAKIKQDSGWVPVISLDESIRKIFSPYMMSRTLTDACFKKTPITA